MVYNSINYNDVDQSTAKTPDSKTRYLREVYISPRDQQLVHSVGERTRETFLDHFTYFDQEVTICPVLPSAGMMTIVRVLCVALSLLVLSRASRMGSVSFGERQLESCHSHCRWAVCPWSINPIVDDNCIFLNFPCRCRAGTSCQQIDRKPTPGNYLTHHYSCVPDQIVN